VICKERHRADPEGSIQKRKTVSNLQKERLTKDVRYQEFREIALGKRSGQAIYQGLFLFYAAPPGGRLFALWRNIVIF